MMTERVEHVANKTVRNPVFFTLIGVCILLISLLIYVVGFGAKANDVRKLGESNNKLLHTITECLQKGNCGKASAKSQQDFAKMVIASNWCSVQTQGLSLGVYEQCVSTLMPKVEFPK